MRGICRFGLQAWVKPDGHSVYIGLTGRCLRWADDASRERKFGVTRKQYDAILAAQGGVCWLCKQTPDFGRESLSVDYDHRCCGDKKRLVATAFAG
jgi:hypothetical protein